MGGKLRYWIPLTLVVLLAGSCRQEPRPDHVLSEPEMVKVLTALYLAEERASRLGITPDSVRKIFPYFSDQVFEKSGIHDSVFQKSMNYYMSHPAQLEHIYTAVVDSLNLKAQGAAVDTVRHVLSQ